MADMSDSVISIANIIKSWMLFINDIAWSQDFKQAALCVQLPCTSWCMCGCECLPLPVHIQITGYKRKWKIILKLSSQLLNVYTSKKKKIKTCIFSLQQQYMLYNWYNWYKIENRNKALLLLPVSF